MVDSVVCYFIDDGYLLPTLVSSIQARTHISADLADVVVIVLGEPTEKSQLAAAVAKKNGVEFLFVPKSLLGGLHPTYGRLFMHKVLPEHYKRIIYIDGDTQVAGSLDPLATAPMQPSTFMAVRDPSVTFARLNQKWKAKVEGDRQKSGYVDNFGDYFNAGFLVINREGWPELAEKALKVLETHGERLVHKDQDVMNIALSANCVHLSSRWNFPGFLIGTRAEAQVQPRIYHFMSNPRPWVEAVEPWGAKWMKPYILLLRNNPELGFLKPRKNLRLSMKYSLQQAFKMMTEYRPVGAFKEAPVDLVI